MAGNTRPQVIAIEEHYYDPEVTKHFTGVDAKLGGPLQGKLYDLDEIRLGEMDEAGIDIQVLSHGAPATQRLEGETAIEAARGANDRLNDTVQARPDRFQAFAVLPTAEPKAAADELERTVTQYGFKGAMVHGLTNGAFLDEKQFWPIFERAQALDVPLYMHPAVPHPAVIEAYYKDYVEDFPAILNAAWGFTVETATQGVRLVLSGVLDEYPDVKIVLGHMGEGLPFLLWRIDHALSRPGNKPVSFREVFSRNVWITTSGNFSDPAMLCSIQELGIDRILFSVDWPFVENKPGTDWMESISLSAEDKAKVLSGNAKRLLKM